MCILHSPLGRSYLKDMCCLRLSFKMWYYINYVAHLTINAVHEYIHVTDNTANALFNLTVF